MLNFSQWFLFSSLPPPFMFDNGRKKFSKHVARLPSTPRPYQKSDIAKELIFAKSTRQTTSTWVPPSPRSFPPLWMRMKLFEEVKMRLMEIIIYFGKKETFVELMLSASGEIITANNIYTTFAVDFTHEHQHKARWDEFRHLGESAERESREIEIEIDSITQCNQKVSSENLRTFAAAASPSDTSLHQKKKKRSEAKKRKKTNREERARVWTRREKRKEYVRERGRESSRREKKTI